ncbi:MAG: hypothetical protein EA399_12440 [Desulfovibrionales bacterium]|nr:MAG: hypothetical protein EA399_12440 [Desulfovibrionales bacterium]
MPTITLKAHFNGKNIQLDEPCDLPDDAQLLVTILSPPPLEAERAAWSSLAAESLSRAYGKDEPEYTMEDIQPS